MQRREFIAFLGGMAVTATRGALAQAPKIYRLGTLTVGPPIPATAGTGAILINSLAKRGYTL
jgi:putative tryptophan/tyrosine transport system substrate-binding protein